MEISFQERRDITSMVSTVVLTAVYVWVLAARVEARGIDLATNLQFWGAAFLVFIPVQVVGKIVMMILFMIGNAIVTCREEEDRSDEMQRLIELRSVRISMWVFMGGFFLAMGLLAAGMGLLAMFVTLAVSIVVSGVAMDLARVVYYHTGL